MIIPKAYDVEILKNFFSIVIIDVNSYLDIFKDVVSEPDKKGKTKPIPLVQKLTVREIKERLNKVKKKRFYITDTDDTQLLQMLGYFNSIRPHYDEYNIPVRTDIFGYNSTNYDSLMVAGFLMYAQQTDNTKELILKLYDLSKKIIELQNNKELYRTDYQIDLLRKYNLPFTNIDVMTIFALNKCGKGVDKKTGETIYFPKSLKQTSINLQWYELLEYELPPISEKDAYLYTKEEKYKGLTPQQLNNLISKWDRYIIDEWIDATLHYNENDVFIVCEMIRLYMDEIKLRYNISKSYEVNVLSSSRSDIANKLFVKFYSDFSGLAPSQWQGRKTERTALAFKRVIFPFIKFKTKPFQDILEEMKSVIIYSIGKDAFKREIKLGKLTYTIATGGLHSQDIPSELKSRIKYIDPPTGKLTSEASDSIWDNITDNSFIYCHADVSDEA